VILPMFPLGTALLPHAPLPLHVFEQRYRALVRDCLAGDRRFGVALIERGSEVGGGDTRFGVACVARIARADELPDGRWMLVAEGVEKVDVLEWLEDAPYPRARVEAVVEPPWTDACDGAFGSAFDSFRRVVSIATELGADIDPGVLDLTGDPPTDAWLLAGRAPVGPLDRHALLTAPNPEARLRLLGELLDDLHAVLAARLHGG
jgi:Lon protease-like protein